MYIRVKIVDNVELIKYCNLMLLKFQFKEFLMLRPYVSEGNILFRFQVTDCSFQLKYKLTVINLSFKPKVVKCLTVPTET